MLCDVWAAPMRSPTCPVGTGRECGPLRSDRARCCPPLDSSTKASAPGGAGTICMGIFEVLQHEPGAFMGHMEQHGLGTSAPPRWRASAPLLPVFRDL